MVSSDKQPQWFEWLCHTNFSFLYGASSPEEIINRAVELGYLGIAITDFDGVYGLARSWRALQNLQKSGKGIGFCLLYGVEFHFKTDHEEPVLYQDTIVLLAQNHQGYINLCKLVSIAHIKSKNRASISLNKLSSCNLNSLVALQPMRGEIRLGHKELVFKRMNILKKLFKEKFYIAISQHLHPAEDNWASDFLQLSKKLHIPLLFSQDPFFHHRSRKDVSDLLHAIRTNQPIDQTLEHLFPNGERSLHSLSEIQALFGHFNCYQEVELTSLNLLKTFDFDLKSLKYHYPQKMIPGDQTPQQYLEQLVWNNLHNDRVHQVSDKMVKLLRRELDLIQILDFADYFLTVFDIVKWARSRDILCQGRGSAANSAVCFVLGITAVDPDNFELLFERFISQERGDPPDIDVDFEHERREEVIQYIYNNYGRNNAAMVANVITFRKKGAIRATGKALGIPEAILDHATKMLHTKYFRSRGNDEVLINTRIDLDNNHESSGDLSNIPWAIWAEMSQKILGFPRHLGIHSGGFILSDQPIDNLVAQEPATMPNRTVIQWSKEDIEALGFFKIDILALGMLTVIKKSFQTIQQFYNQNISLASIPENDPSTYKMIKSADTVGVFQIESRAQMSMLPRLRPNNFYDLVIQVAIIRPGPISGGMIHPFLRRRNGFEEVTFPDSRLEAILKRTMGVPIFQEQVMRIAIAVGGFTPGESDELRRHIGSFNMKEREVERWIQKLEKGMQKNGLEDDFIQSIISYMMGFSSYGFPESHAASFALLAYASSYLKCHFPAPFFLGLLNSQPVGFYQPHTLIQTARRDGVSIFPACINKSAWFSELEWDIKSNNYGIRLGFHQIKGVQHNLINDLILQRNELGCWTNFQTFLEDVSLPRDVFSNLAAANVFQSLKKDRRSSLWHADASPYQKNFEVAESKIHFKAETPMENVRSDFKAFGTTLDDHPTLIIRRDLWCFRIPIEKIITSDSLALQKSGQIISVFGMVLVRQAPGTAKGVMFITLEDENGGINLVIKPHVYQQFHKLIDNNGFLCVSGRLQKINESISILVTRIYQPYSSTADIFHIKESKQKRLSTQKIPLQNFVKSINYH